MSMHPEILSLQRLKDQGREEIKLGKYEDLIDTLWCWNVELKEEDQDTELITLLEKEIATLDTFKYPGGKEDRIKKHIPQYKNWYKRTMKHTWKKGYFENKKYDSSGLDQFKEEDGWTPA